jgi:hypothetical protein
MTAAAALTLVLASAAIAASFDERHRADLAANPADLIFVLKTSNGQRTFHPGEAIPISLEFSSNVPEKYALDIVGNDHGGPRQGEEFVVDRDSAVDPLADYFGSGINSVLDGGAHGRFVLGPEPAVAKLWLNGWFRFDKPGTYRIYLKSHRVWRERVASDPGDDRSIPITPVSNILEIEITTPDPAWEDAQLARLRGILEHSQRDSLGDEIRGARRELGFLGTPGAVRLILDLARGEAGEIDDFGLARSPHREFVVTELDRYIAEPDTAVTL